MYAVTPDNDLYHFATLRDRKYQTLCGLPVIGIVVFDKPQQHLPVLHLSKERPAGRRLCATCHAAGAAAV